MTAFLDEPRDVQAVLAQLDHTFNVSQPLAFTSTLSNGLPDRHKWTRIARPCYLVLQLQLALHTHRCCKRCIPERRTSGKPRCSGLRSNKCLIGTQARLLREDQYQDFLDHVAYQPPDSLILRKADMNRTITFRSERDPAQISWKALQVLHVVECAGDFTTVESASQHLHVPICFDRESDFASIHGIEFGEQGGAMKVLIASTSESCNAPKIYPGINDMECKFHEYVVACAPPYTADRNAPAEWEDLWQYSRQVLRLLS